MDNFRGVFVHGLREPVKCILPVAEGLEDECDPVGRDVRLAGLFNQTRQEVDGLIAFTAQGSAVRVTLVGSITPAATRSSYCSVEALKP